MNNNKVESSAIISPRIFIRDKEANNCQASLRTVWNFLEKYVSFCNTHGAEFITHKHWDKYIPYDTQEHLLNLSNADLIELPLIHLKDQGKSVEEPHEMLSSGSDWLYNYITEAYQCHLENLNVLSTLEESGFDYSCCSSTPADAMSIKKSHEVGIMSQVISTVFTSTKADLVVDVGSGKGYLGAELAVRHNIPTLGLDSSDSNTHGARRRDELLGKKFKRKKKEVVISGLKDDVNNCVRCGDSCTREIEHHRTAICTETDCSVDNVTEYVPVTTFVQPNMDLRKTIQSLAPHLCHRQLDISSLRLFLTGLHTCGSLAVTLLKLFLQDPGAVGLVSVGCCYQQMEEVDTTNEERSNFHFPVSDYGQKLNLYLGRNARNLAAQSVHRIQASKQLQGKDFYWRALLDVMIRKLGLTVPERIKGIRGLTKKCQSFKDYAFKALKNLGLSPDLVPNDVLEMTEIEHKDTEMKMAALFQLKLVLAPVIESLILLDRYMFLLEQVHKTKYFWLLKLIRK
ncbi:hypothetical protein Btru_022326 [Bulinus truncatus]|nr:hypothetical protein Btru_022326 [Bulinus truncatus]